VVLKNGTVGKIGALSGQDRQCIVKKPSGDITGWIDDSAVERVITPTEPTECEERGCTDED
jgi:hypothetical protein